jgi:hypothetical protein
VVSCCLSYVERPRPCCVIAHARAPTHSFIHRHPHTRPPRLPPPPHTHTHPRLPFWLPREHTCPAPWACQRKCFDGHVPPAGGRGPACPRGCRGCRGGAVPAGGGGRVGAGCRSCSSNRLSYRAGACVSPCVVWVQSRSVPARLEMCVPAPACCPLASAVTPAMRAVGFCVLGCALWCCSWLETRLHCLAEGWASVICRPQPVQQIASPSLSPCTCSLCSTP